MKTLMYLTLNGKTKKKNYKKRLYPFLKYFEDFSKVILLVVEGLLLGNIGAISKRLQSVEDNLNWHLKLYHC